MFSEYEDKKVDTKDEKEQENQDEIEVKDWKNETRKKEDEKMGLLQSDISSKMTEYRWFFDSYPNNFHEDTSKLSTWDKFYESMASGIWEITEKKIKWFDRDLSNGKKAEVREEWWQIYIKISQELKDGNRKELSISLNNFEMIANPQDNIQPTISINWDELLLNDLLGKNNLNNDIQSWDRTINEVLSMNSNMDLFQEVFDSVNERIITQEKEELYGYVDHAKKIIDSDQFPEFLLKQDNWTDTEWWLNQNSFVEYLITNIEQGTIGENTLEQQDLVACKVLLSLCILLRNSSNNIQAIKKTLWFPEDKNIWKERTIQWWENLIEFLPINETDLKKFMACRDEVIDLGVKEIENEKAKLLSSENISAPNYNQKWWEITRLLNCLNK